ncbi:putative ribosome biogenesis [Phaeomoniella chlamydospora]|uniref:Putative ribosome biogenesis n=1 Tax=Phaeomoniella chlamydospora TaxID=158046 RepID=A0A0G2EQN9_PHACM|nr:putative ribosome biogenesis [Phaeomoniella chlamydospora]
MAEVTKKRRLSAEGDYEPLVKIDSVQVPAKQNANEDKKDQRRSLFVRSLPTSFTTEQLAEHFSRSYPIKHATIIQDPTTKVSKGYGFVTFADPEDAQQAIAEFNGSRVEGRKIKVELAQSRHRDLAGEGGKSVPSAEALKQKAERESNKADAQPPKLIIRNLPWTIKEPEDLSNLFRSYGKVKSAVIPKKGPRAQSGFGFVVIRGRKNAERALEGVNGKEVDGRTLAVDWAVDKETWEKLQKSEEQVGAAEDVDGPENPELAGEDPDAESSDNASKEYEWEDDASDADLVDNDAELSELEEVAGFDEEKPADTEEDDSANSSTIFLRNLPFTTDDDALYEHFTSFGPVRYARVVYDPETERSRGTGFVCFYKEETAKECVVNAPKPVSADQPANTKTKGDKPISVLQNEAADPSGRYTIDGRVLQVSRALRKEVADRKEAEGSDRRIARDRDKRRLFLLSEGTIFPGSALYNKLGPTEISMRAASAKQRQNLIKSNPSLHLSLTRLSVRNLPRSVTSKDLKALAREAVVGFATDVKNKLREPLSKEEIVRGAEEMKESERQRKLHGKGIVKQAKIVFESSEGSKIGEKTGAGRSRGYGFIEYYNHRNALMGLRWLNGHPVKSTGSAGKEERQKRLIVEFAIENSQVVKRRQEIEEKARKGEVKQGRFAPKATGDWKNGKENGVQKGDRNNKRKRSDSRVSKEEGTPTKKGKKESGSETVVPDEQNKIAKRNRIIAKKRQARKARGKGK